MLKIAICDDVPTDSSHLEKLLIDYQSPLSFDHFSSPHKLLEQADQDYHCFFLDIDMPQMSGIDLAAFLRENYPHTPIIFLTAYKEYMDQVFEVQPFDYLLKPLKKERLYQTLQRIERYVGMDKQLFTFSFEKEHYILETDRIIYFEKNRRQVLIHTQEKTYKTLLTTKELLKKLPVSFIQIHASFIINARYVSHFTTSSVNLQLLPNPNDCLPISRKFQQSFKTAYMTYLQERVLSC